MSTTAVFTSAKADQSNNAGVAPIPATTERGNALVTKIGHEGGQRKLHMVPPCSSVEELLGREKRHMAGAFRVFAKLGFADGASGHISLRGEPFNISLFLHLPMETSPSLSNADENKIQPGRTPSGSIHTHSILGQSRSLTLYMLMKTGIVYHRLRIESIPQASSSIRRSTRPGLISTLHVIVMLRTVEHGLHLGRRSIC